MMHFILKQKPIYKIKVSVLEIRFFNFTCALFLDSISKKETRINSFLCFHVISFVALDCEVNSAC